MRLTALISYHLTASTAALCTCGLCSHNHRPWEILPLLACHDALRLLLQHQPLVLIYGHGMSAPGLETLNLLVLTQKAKACRTSRSYPKTHPKNIGPGQPTLVHPWTPPKPHCYSNASKWALKNNLQFGTAAKFFLKAFLGVVLLCFFM